MTDKTTVVVDAVELHRCTGCAATLEACDKRLLRRGTPCCGQCHQTDTHHNEDFEANCRRMELLREGVSWADALRQSTADPEAPQPTTRVVAGLDVLAVDVHGGDLLVVAGSPARVIELDRTGGTTKLVVVLPSNDRVTLHLSGTDRVVRLWKGER